MRGVMLCRWAVDLIVAERMGWGQSDPSSLPSGPTAHQSANVQYSQIAL